MNKYELRELAVSLAKEKHGTDKYAVLWGAASVLLSDNDLQRRNTIAKLLVDWGLVKISNPDYFTDYAPLSQIKVISHKEKNEWMLETKYNIGKKKLTTSTK